MNERINELAIKAGGIWRGGYVEKPNGDSVYTDRKFVSGGDMDVEQFAELLIVKCANIIWHEADTKDSAEINEGGYKILEHFGIDWTTK